MRTLTLIPRKTFFEYVEDYLLIGFTFKEAYTAVEHDYYYV
jgi:hypothetical protein